MRRGADVGYNVRDHKRSCVDYKQLLDAVRPDAELRRNRKLDQLRRTNICESQVVSSGLGGI